MVTALTAATSPNPGLKLMLEVALIKMHREILCAEAGRAQRCPAVVRGEALRCNTTGFDLLSPSDSWQRPGLGADREGLQPAALAGGKLLPHQPLPLC